MWFQFIQVFFKFLEKIIVPRHNQFVEQELQFPGEDSHTGRLVNKWQEIVKQHAYHLNATDWGKKNE